jgi:hypothetical protein
MPWEHTDAVKHTKLADNPERSKLWSKIANHTLDATGDEGAAIRSANSVLRHQADAKAAAPAAKPAARPAQKSTLGVGMTFRKKSK